MSPKPFTPMKIKSAHSHATSVATAKKTQSGTASLLKKLSDKANLAELNKEFVNLNKLSDHGEAALGSLFKHIKKVSPFPKPVFEAMLEQPGFAPSLTDSLNFLIDRPHRDTVLIHQVLKKEINFDKVTAVPFYNEERILVLGARRKKMLYSGTIDQPSELDQLLMNFDTTAAREYLTTHGFHGPKIADLWGDAVANGRHDVLRAVLILGDVNGNTTFRSQEKKKIPDPQILEVLKGIPSVSIKRPIINLNGGHQFKDKDGTIVCRHVVADGIVVYQKMGGPGFVSKRYEDGKALVENVDYSSEKKFTEITGSTAISHLIGYREFGRFLEMQFSEIQYLPDRKKYFVLVAGNHAMWIGLQEKQLVGKPSYVVHFYDPNLTSTWARTRHNLPSSFSLDCFTDYLQQPNYLHDGRTGSIIIHRFGPGRENNNGTPLTFGLQRFEIVSLGYDEFRPSLIARLFSCGFSEQLNHADINKYLKSCGPDAIDRLAKELRYTWNNIEEMMILNSDGMFQAYAKVFPLFSSEQIFNILMTGGSPSYSALRRGLKYDAIKNIKFFAEFFDHMRPEHRKAVALGHDTLGESEIVNAIKRGAAPTLLAFKVILSKVAAKDRRTVLLGSHGGKPARQALKEASGKKNGVRRAYASLVQLVPVGDRAGLMPTDMFYVFKLEMPAEKKKK